MMTFDEMVKDLERYVAKLEEDNNKMQKEIVELYGRIDVANSRLIEHNLKEV